MTKFIRLMRNEDVHGNSGTGCVLVGAVFTGGQVAYMWKGELTVMHWALSVDQLRSLHEHEGRGEIEVLDTDKFNSMRVLDMFMEGLPMSEINKKLKKKYLPKKEEEEEGGEADEEETS